MDGDSILFTFFLIFTGASVLATLALWSRQALLIAYICLGLLLGPSGIAIIPDPQIIENIAQIGIIFLLFLLGLNLPPKDLAHLLKEATFVTLASSTVFNILGVVFCLSLGLSTFDSIIVGCTLMFSSTIIGLKLLPTTILHHQHTGEVITSILLLQDIIAIGVLLVLQGYSHSNTDALYLEFLKLFITLPGLALASYLFEKYIITRLILKFDRIQEYLFLVSIGWCLGVAELAHYLGLSHEMGAFIAGVSMATSPISLIIAESLKPLRDFFLIMFFFAIGASFDLSLLTDIFIPSLSLAAILLFVKPKVFEWLLIRSHEKPKRAKEIGYRLGQVSEFSLLVAVLGMELELLSDKASYLIQLTTLITFMYSAFWVVRTYPTPISLNDNLRQD